MNRKRCIFPFLVLMLAALIGCSGEKSATQGKQGPPLDKIQGKAQVLVESGGPTDAALNAGGSSIYLWVGLRRYRLFLRTPVEIVHGKEYVAEGINAQKTIDELGDPDNGKNGYPLEASCRKAVTRAWSNLSFDTIDPTVSLVRARVKRYPARPLFLVTRIKPAEAASEETKKEAADDRNVKEITVGMEKQRALLLDGPTIQTAPLWEPAGGTVRCKVVIDTEGKIDELDTGAQLCEVVDWSLFRFQPPVQAGKPVKVDTEVEIRFEPRK